WPGLASAARFSEQPAGPQMGMSPSGFVGVIGPEGYAPEHYESLSPPPPGFVCPSCPPSDRSPAQHPPQPAQR
ncbi:MAG TPA: hypothetical protein VIZ17_13430, partial [Acetobacteraceae bacterium]